MIIMSRRCHKSAWKEHEDPNSFGKGQVDLQEEEVRLEARRDLVNERSSWFRSSKGHLTLTVESVSYEKEETTGFVFFFIRKISSQMIFSST